jgi:hypothetical protein
MIFIDLAFATAFTFCLYRLFRLIEDLYEII